MKKLIVIILSCLINMLSNCTERASSLETEQETLQLEYNPAEVELINLLTLMLQDNEEYAESWAANHGCLPLLVHLRRQNLIVIRNALSMAIANRDWSIVQYLLESSSEDNRPSIVA